MNLLDMAKNSMNRLANYNNQSDNNLIEKYANKFDMSNDAMAKSWGTEYTPESRDYFQSAPAPEVMPNELDFQGVSEELDPEGVSEEYDINTLDVNNADSVRNFQEVYGLEPDGVFGPKSEARLRELQSNNTTMQSNNAPTYGFGRYTDPSNVLEDAKKAAHYGSPETSSWDNFKTNFSNAWKRNL
jgi:hypothetical protein